MRLELMTPCLKGRCSNRLSYGPMLREDSVFPTYSEINS